MSLIIFLAIVFLVTFLVGRLLEKIRIPWIFSALLIGFALAAYNPFSSVTSSQSFILLGRLGMYLLLFLVGFELDIEKILKSSRFILSTTFVVILTESVFGSILVHYIFGTPWIIAILVASSFATVGEAILLPILDEFRLVRTKLGQTILSIGAADDIIEIIILVVVSVLVGRSIGHSHFSIWSTLFVLALLFGIFLLLIKFRSKFKSLKCNDNYSLFFLVMIFIFIFIGIGNFVGSAALGALLAGISMKNIIPKRFIDFISDRTRTITYGFFAPIFFVWVGIDTNIGYIIKFPLLIMLFIAMTKSTKILSSYFMGRNVLGPKKSTILGIGLSVKFSTSIVILKLLFENALIQSQLYSILLGTMVAFKFVAPLLLSYLLPKWKIGNR